jgi:hypothetical protein
MDRSIEREFVGIGANAQQTRRAPRWPTTIDIRRNAGGEYFDLQIGCDDRAEVVDADAEDRHLLLRVQNKGVIGDTATFLCGHDERAWFVAAIPETANASTVQAAKDTLKPPAVWEAMREFGVPMAHRDLRRTRAFVRQGEWFFIPRPLLEVKHHQVSRNEPIRRGAGRPHICQFLHRLDGYEVYVNESHPNGLREAEYRSLPRDERLEPWERMYRDARVFVRGSIRHPDHETVSFRIWHEVVANTESQAAAMRGVAFLD